MKTTKDQVLLIYLNNSLFIDNELFWSQRPSLIEFFSSLANNFKEIQLLLPVKKISGAISANKISFLWNVKVIDLPLTRNYKKTIVYSPFITMRLFKIIFGNIDSWDVIGCAGNTFVGSILALASRIKSKPVFFYLRGNKSEIFLSRYPKGIKKYFYQFLVKCLEFFMVKCIDSGAPLFAVGRELCEKYSGRGRFVYNVAPILSNDFLEKTKNDQKVEERSLLKVLFVGWVDKRKGVFDLIDACKLAYEKNSINLNLVLAGSRTDKNFIDHYLGNVPFRDKVELKGYRTRDQLFSDYQEADLFVLPSYAEGMPRVIAEAMAMELPVIASRVGGIPEMIEDGVTGFLISPGDIGALTEKLIYFAKNKNQLVKMGQKARSKVKEYTFSHQRKIFIDKLSNHFK